MMILGCALIAGGCDRQSESPAQPQPEAGDKAAADKLDRSHAGEPIPDMTFADAAGDETSLPSLKGKPVLINLWATWCAPCIAELPTLEALNGKSGLGIAVVTVAQDSAEPASIEAFLDDRGLSGLPSLRDPDSDLTFHYGTGVLPTSVLYDAAGKEVWRTIGERDWTSMDSAKLLAEGRAN